MDCPPENVIPEPSRRPRDFAILHLAIGTGPPRARARDQQADVAGGELLRNILDRVASIDPEPDDLEATLAQIVFEIGDPTGPTRAVCSQFLEEWSQTQYTPGAWQWLITEALERSGRGDEPRKKRRRFDGDS